MQPGCDTSGVLLASELRCSRSRCLFQNRLARFSSWLWAPTPPWHREERLPLPGQGPMGTLPSSPRAGPWGMTHSRRERQVRVTQMTGTDPSNTCKVLNTGGARLLRSCPIPGLCQLPSSYGVTLGVFRHAGIRATASPHGDIPLTPPFH